MGKDGPLRGLQVHVAAFGKHPGWDDHIEEIGLSSPVLLNAKRLLYTEGLAGNIDSGAWDRLEESKRLPGFKHNFYWRTGSGLILGRMWSSRDGKGRTKYPMVVCVLVEGAPEWWAVERVLPRLAEMEEKCTQTQSAELVRLAVGEARRAIEEEASVVAAGATVPASDDASLVRKLTQSAAMDVPGPGGTGLGLKRVLYEVDRETGGTVSKNSKIVDITAQHIRVPACLPGPGDSARAWMGVMGELVGKGMPLLVIEPVGGKYLDVVFGEPKASHLFCVRASQAGLALTTDVPYAIDESFSGKVAPMIDRWSRGELAKAGSSGAGARGTGQRARPPWVLIGAGGVIVLAAVGLVLMMRAGNKPTTPPAPTPNEPIQTPPRTVPHQETDAATGKARPAPASSGQADGGDPRSVWGFDGALAQARAALAALAKELKDQGVAVPATLGEQLERAAKRAEVTRAMSYTPANRDAIEREMRVADEQLNEAKSAIDVARAAATGAVRDMLRDAASSTALRSAPMRAAWETSVLRIDPGIGMVEARSRVAALANQMESAEKAIGGIQPVEVPAALSDVASAVRAAGEARLEQATRQAADAAGTGDAARLAGVAAEYRKWTAGVGDALAKGAALSEGLANGGSGAEVSATLRDVKASPGYESVSGALASIISRAEGVKALTGEADAAKVLRAIEEASRDTVQARGAVVMAGLERLGELGWPGTCDRLPELVSVVKDHAGPVIARIADEKARSQATSRARKIESAMVAAAAARCESGASLDKVSEALQGLGLTEEGAGLPGWVRYNLARRAFERALASAPSDDAAKRSAAIRTASKAFAERAESLGTEVSLRPEVAPLLEAAKKEGAKEPKADLSRSGPAGAGWKFEEGPDGTAVYSLSGPAGEQKLAFNRVEVSANKSIYLATTEVSVGQFVNAVSAAGKWEEIGGMLVKFQMLADDPRRGPRTWEWSFNGQVSLVPASQPAGQLTKGWLRPRPGMRDQSYYPADVVVDPPSYDSPMQYVSPQAALEVALVMGCRLPTSAEWKAALAAEPGSATGANLRDATWKKVFDYLRTLAASNPEWPSAGIYSVPGSTRVLPVNDTAPAVETSDGVVWFTPVAAGSASAKRFRNLIGNVWELVFEDSSACDGVEGVVGTKVEAILGKGEALKVIGGSALSPGTISTTEPQPVALTQARDGFSDVGFRLAFASAGQVGESSGGGIEDAMKASGYLSK